MIGKRIKNLIWIFVEKFGLIVVSCVAFYIFATYLSAEEYGLGIFAIAIVEFFSIFFSGLWNDPLVRQKNRLLDAYASVFWLGGLLAIFTMSLLNIVIFIFNDNVFLNTLILIASVKVVAVVLARPFVAQMRRDRNFKVLAVRTLSGKLLGAFFGITMAIYGYGALAVVMQLVVMELFSLLVLMRGNVKQISSGIDLKLFIKLCREGVPIALRQIVAGSLIKGTTIILGLTTSASVVGYFGFANRLVELPFAALNTGLRSYSLPVISSRFNNGQNISQLITRLSLATAFLLVPVFLMTSVLAPPIFEFFFAGKWADSVTIFQMFAILTAFKFLFLYHGISIIAIGKAKVGMLYEVSNALVTFIIVWLLSESFGLLGVVVAFSINLLLDFIIKIWSLRQVLDYQVSYFLSALLKIVVAGAIMLVAMNFINESSIYLYLNIAFVLSVGMIVYLLILTMLRFDFKLYMMSVLNI